MIDQEKDDLANERARAQHQIDSLRANERELRSHFVEITSLGLPQALASAVSTRE